ncbi:MAG TPA: hypothetical protein VI981_04490 [Candidatus Paceibacterota bacterium]
MNKRIQIILLCFLAPVLLAAVMFSQINNIVEIETGGETAKSSQTQEKKGCDIKENRYGEGFHGVDIRGGVVCYFNITKNKDPYIFVVTANERNQPQTIDVYYATKLVQTLNLGPEKQSPESPVSTDFIDVDDINFDGKNDLRIVQSTGVTGNVYYLFYVFNPKLSSFEYSEEFSQLPNYARDPEKKIITTHINTGAAGAAFVEETYEVKNDTLVLVRYVEQRVHPDYGDSFLKTTKVLRGGEMIIEKEERVLAPFN